MANALMQKLLKVGSSSGATTSILSESAYFNKKDIIPTELPILNIAFSGEVDGGLVSGLTVFAGPSKTFKSLLGLYCLRAYLNKYEDAFGILYDSEFGITPKYLRQNGIDPARVLHVPIENIEQLKFDMAQKLQEVKRGDHVFILVDSAGALPSVKEVQDSLDGKSVADMSRAKALRSWLRQASTTVNVKDLPCVIIQHTYETMELYSKAVVSGGTAFQYFPNQVFIIGKSQDKDGTELVGFKFTINIDKSRFVKEKSKLPFYVSFKDGVDRYSSILELALESGDVNKPSNGWYELVDTDTGEVISGKVREAATNSPDFLGVVLKREKFKTFVKGKFQLSGLVDMDPDDFSDIEDEAEDLLEE